MSLSIEITDLAGRPWSLQPKPTWKSVPSDDEFYALRYSSSMPGGFADCSFRLRRDPRYDYVDLGYYNRVTVYAGVQPVWDGEMRGLGQIQGPDGHELEIRCLGHSAVLGDAPYNRIWSDDRYQMWQVSDQISRNVKPQLWILDNNNRIFAGARNGVSYDNTIAGEWQYAEPFGVDKVHYVTFDFDVALVNTTWRAELAASDNADISAGDVLWTRTTSGTGTQTITLATKRRYLLFQLVYNTGTPAVLAGADASTYMKITNLKVQTTDALINAQTIAQDIVSKYSAAAYNLSSDNGFVTAVTLALAPIWFDEDRTAEDVMNMLAEMGDGSTPPKPVGWFIWDDKKLRLETLDYQNVKYVLDREDAEITVSGDLQAAYMRAYSIYQNSAGRAVRTATRDVFTDVLTGLSDPWSGRKRIRSLDAQFTSASARAQSWADLWLVRNGLPIGKSSYKVRGGYIDDRYGQKIPLAEVRADGLLEVPLFKAYEAVVPSSTDVRDRVSVDYLVYTEYDYDNDELMMTPGEPTPTFQRQLAALRRRIGPDAGYLQRKLVGLPTA